MCAQQDLQQLKNKLSLKLPSQNRPRELSVLRQIEELFFYQNGGDKKIPIFNPQAQQEDLSLAETQWQAIDDRLKTTRVCTSLVQVRAVFESLTKTAVGFADRVAPQFGGSAKTNWLGTIEAYVTSKLITIFSSISITSKTVLAKQQQLPKEK